jgi:bifunctional DNA-binding transcriptional regulator/antitoxin component of YhaV-PrlF toxin-antitoxin module
VTALGSGKKPAVRVIMRGYSYRSTVATMGGRFMIPVSAEVRANAGVAGGDEVEVDLELDTEPRAVSVPADFQQALDRDEAARRAFDELNYSNKRRHVLTIEGTKSQEMRRRRIEKAISTLREGG